MNPTSFYKFALGPVLLAQGSKMRRTTLRLPEAAGQRDGHILIGSEPTELRLLFVGDSTMAGVGVEHQTCALPFQVATSLATRLDRSVRWQTVAKSGINTSQALEFAKGQALLPADVVITALGTNDVTSQRKPDQFVNDYKVLISTLSNQVGASFAIISGLAPLHLTQAAPQPLRWYLGKYANTLDVGLRQWIKSQTNIAYVSLQWASNANEMAADGYHPGKNQYRAWAELVSESIANFVRHQEEREAPQMSAEPPSQSL
jgi:lysophospholipase L1-like esterase